MNIFNTMLDIKYLPVPKLNCRAHYEGSIDKQGYNADWDWFLYQDEHQEYVLFEHIGPGCIYNFVQHRYPSCEEPEFRFYFDGEDTPRFAIRHSQFGEKYPLVEPAASRYIGPYDNGRGPIRVIRSFVPMPYAKSCKITSTIRLAGCDRAKNEGGWGHVIYHAYESSNNIQTFTPCENPDIERLTNLWKQSGSRIHPVDGSKKLTHSAFTLLPGDTYSLCSFHTAQTITGLRILTKDYNPQHLHDLSVEAFWDEHKAADLNADFGCLFSNELGYHAVRYLLSGMNTFGSYYNFYPMPFSSSGRMLLKNNGDTPVTISFCEIYYTTEWNAFYDQYGFLYYRSAPYYTRKHTEGADSILAEVSGCGHIVSSIITAYGETSESRADCEGDVRIHFDGIRTPQIESDGSESYSCYGWGFETPPEYNPASGYDGHEHKDWSMHRSLMGDWYPFFSGFRFGIESGGCNDLYMEHSGMVFYYGNDESLLKKLGEINFEDPGSLKAADYHCAEPPTFIRLTSNFEGDDDNTDVTFTGHYETCRRQFTIAFPENISALILRRVSDQQKGRQKAFVWADDTQIENQPWYFPDCNPYKRWLEDEFFIRQKYLEGKTKITITIIPQPYAPDSSDETVWNEFGYQFFARTNPSNI